MSSTENESTQEISNSLQMDNMDVENVTSIVGELADVSGLDKILKPALQQLFLTHSGTERQFRITINGVTLRIHNICREEQRTKHDDYYQLNLVDDEVGCWVDVTAIDKVETNTYTVDSFYDQTFGYISDTIVNLCKARRICKTCDQLIEGMEGFDMCAKCACWEPIVECCRCSVKRGRTNDYHGVGHEHSSCKRRRIMADSD